MKTKLYAPHISYSHCAMAIKRELSAVKGLTSVSVDVAGKSVDIVYDKEETLERIKTILEDIGYPVALG